MSAVADGHTAVQQAFERLGRIREHLTGLQTFAADLEDAQLSVDLRGAITVNTRLITRVHQLLEEERATGPLDRDLAVSTSSGPEGDRS